MKKTYILFSLIVLLILFVSIYIYFINNNFYYQLTVPVQDTNKKTVETTVKAWISVDYKEKDVMLKDYLTESHGDKHEAKLVNIINSIIKGDSSYFLENARTDEHYTADELFGTYSRAFQNGLKMKLIGILKLSSDTAFIFERIIGHEKAYPVMFLVEIDGVLLFSQSTSSEELFSFFLPIISEVENKVLGDRQATFSDWIMIKLGLYPNLVIGKKEQLKFYLNDVIRDKEEIGRSEFYTQVFERQIDTNLESFFINRFSLTSKQYKTILSQKGENELASIKHEILANSPAVLVDLENLLIAYYSKRGHQLPEIEFYYKSDGEYILFQPVRNSNLFHLFVRSFESFNQASNYN